MGVFFSVLGAALVIAFLCYVALILLPFLGRRADALGDPGVFGWHFFVPCRDESAVIEQTITRLRATFLDAHVWVVDDDSEDDTASRVATLAKDDPFVHLIRRTGPQARTGKGAALNDAYRAFRVWGSALDLSRTIVCVVDADGELSANALAVAAGPKVFGDDRVGAAQLAVWMKNRDARTSPHGQPLTGFARYLVRMQDIEFRGVIAAMQTLRGRTGTVGLGGNGQFTRAAALEAVASATGQPWHGSLLEDYELGVHVLLAGYEVRQIHDAHVEQEGLTNARRFWAQRTRWAQGNIQCLRYLPRLLRSRYVSATGAVESAYYLLLPFLQLLGLLTWTLAGVVMIGNLAADPALAAERMLGSWPLLIVYVLIGIGPFAIWGPIYRAACEPTATRRRALLWGLGMWVYSFYCWPTTIRAFLRVLTGRSGWAKTRRNSEVHSPELVAREH